MIKDTWEVVREAFGFKVAIVLIVLIATVFASWSVFLYTQGIWRESRTPYLNLQLQFCQDIVDHTSVIVTSHIPADKEKSVVEFWKYYHGRLVLVDEGDELEDAMVKFGELINGEIISRKEPLNHTEMTSRAINKAALQVAIACRDRIQAGWTSNLFPW